MNLSECELIMAPTDDAFRNFKTTQRSFKSWKQIIFETQQFMHIIFVDNVHQMSFKVLAESENKMRSDCVFGGPREGRLLQGAIVQG